MSLTANTSYVTGIDPVYNPINYIFYSDSSNYLNYKYVFDLYSGQTTSGPLLSTIKLNPRPDGSCQYDPHRILESITSADLLIANITGYTQSQNEFQNYTLTYDEQFNGIRFYDNQFCFDTPYLGNVGFVVQGYQPFTTGDTINVQQDATDVFSGYNGNHSVVLITTPLYVSGQLVVVDSLWITATTTNGGYLNYASGSTNWYLTGSTITATTFNGVLQYVNYPTWDPSLYNITTFSANTSHLYLTNQPRSGVYIKNATDRGTASFMIDSPTTLSASTKLTLYVGNTPLNAIIGPEFTIQRGIYHIPSGIWNLNKMFNNAITDNITSYTIQVMDRNTGAMLTEALTYLIDQRCSKYDTVRLQFLNRLGGWDYVNFDMVSRTSVNLTKRDTFKKLLPVGYVVGDRQTTIIDIDGTYIYNVTSNWMNNAQSAWIEELFTSQNVNIINSDGTSWPVNIQQNSLEIQKSINQKMITYTFDLESAYSINGSRG